MIERKPEKDKNAERKQQEEAKKELQRQIDEAISKYEKKLVDLPKNDEKQYKIEKLESKVKDLENYIHHQ